MKRALFCFCFFIPVLLCPEDLRRTMDLAAAVDIGLKNNRELRWAEAENDIAFKTVKLKYRKFFPELSLGYSSNSSVGYFAPDSRMKQLSAGISQLIYDKGALRSSLGISRRKLELEKMENSAERTKFIFSVIESCKDVLRSRRELEITEEAYKAVALQTEIGAVEKELGEITEFDFLELELVLADMEMEREKAIQKRDARLLTFAGLLNLSPDSLPFLTGELDYDYSGFSSDDENYYVAEAVKRSPAVMEKEILRREAYENHKILKKNKFPDIFLSCDFLLYGETFPLDERSFSLILNFDFGIPAFPVSIKTGAGKKSAMERNRNFSAEALLENDLEDFYSERKSMIESERSSRRFEKFLTDIELRIRELVKEIRMLKKNLDIARKKVELERKKLDMEKLKTELGEMKRLDLAESEIAFAENRIEVFGYISELYSKERELMDICGMTDTLTPGKMLIKGSGL